MKYSGLTSSSRNCMPISRYISVYLPISPYEVLRVDIELEELHARPAEERLVRGSVRVRGGARARVRVGVRVGVGVGVGGGFGLGPAAAAARRRARSLYLPISPCISLYLPYLQQQRHEGGHAPCIPPLSPCISLYLPVSPYISPTCSSSGMKAGTLLNMTWSGLGLGFGLGLGLGLVRVRVRVRVG